MYVSNVCPIICFTSFRLLRVLPFTSSLPRSLRHSFPLSLHFPLCFVFELCSYRALALSQTLVPSFALHDFASFVCCLSLPHFLLPPIFPSLPLPSKQPAALRYIDSLVYDTCTVHSVVYLPSFTSCI